MASEPESRFYRLRVCLSTPTGSGSFSGVQPVTANATFDGDSPGIQRAIFYLDGNYVLTDYQKPYTFQLDTRRFSDGPHQIDVEFLLRDGFVSAQAALPVVFANVGEPPPPNTDLGAPTTGRPRSPGEEFVVAATGDGVGGEDNAAAVTDLIESWNPNLLLYLGDVYERGSPSEFDNWYGGRDSSSFGRLRDITDPIVGNHEYLTPDAAGYFDYWNGIPDYYSFNAGGWHFIALNSNGQYQSVAPGSAQYTWLQQDLAENQSNCTLVMAHHPFFSVGPEGSTPQLDAIWSLLVSNGVDIVLTGHDHSYQRWQALDADGTPDANGTTQFVVGTGGHGIQSEVRFDDRVAAIADDPSVGFGALRLSLTPISATFEFINTNGDTLDAGSVNCDPTPEDCTVSAPASHSYQLHVCLATPGADSSIYGNEPVLSTATIDGDSPGIQRVIFSLDGNELFDDNEAPYSLQLETQRFGDGPHDLEVEYVMNDGFVSDKTDLQLDFNNATRPASSNVDARSSSTSDSPTHGERFGISAPDHGNSGENTSATGSEIRPTGGSDSRDSWHYVWGRVEDVTNGTSLLIIGALAIGFLTAFGFVYRRTRHDTDST